MLLCRDKEAPELIGSGRRVRESYSLPVFSDVCGGCPQVYDINLYIGSVPKLGTKKTKF